MSTLRGRVVIVTRPEGQAADLASALRARGAEVIEAPAIRLEPVAIGGALDDSIREAAGGRYAWVVFTSAAGVEAWFDRAAALELGPDDLRARVAVVGAGTSDALDARGRQPDLIPESFTTQSQGEAIPAGSREVLQARADVASGELDGAIRARGWTPVPVDAYRTVLAERLPDDARAALEAGKVDAVAFTSASTVRGFIGAAGRVPDGVPAVCIGPVTTAAAREAGMDVAAEADPHTVEGLADAIARALDA